MKTKTGKAKPRGQRGVKDLAAGKTRDVKGGGSKFVAKPAPVTHVIQDGAITDSE